MVATRNVLRIAASRILLALLLVTQTIAMVDACAYAMPDCVHQCPSGPCDGLGPNICGATDARADRAPGSDGGIAVPAIHSTVAAVPGTAVVEGAHNAERWRSTALVQPPAYIVLHRMLN